MLMLAMACPVCFGQADSPMAQATNMGIIVMLVVVAAVLVGFATFFTYLIRRANAVATGPTPGELGSEPRPEASRYMPEEGTA
jgi:predicted transporter